MLAAILSRLNLNKDENEEISLYNKLMQDLEKEYPFKSMKQRQQLLYYNIHI